MLIISKQLIDNKIARLPYPYQRSLKVYGHSSKYLNIGLPHPAIGDTQGSRCAAVLHLLMTTNLVLNVATLFSAPPRRSILNSKQYALWLYVF